MKSKNVRKECMFFKRFGVKRSSVLFLAKSGIKVFVADGDTETDTTPARATEKPAPKKNKVVHVQKNKKRKKNDPG